MPSPIYADKVAAKFLAGVPAKAGPSRGRAYFTPPMIQFRERPSVRYDLPETAGNPRMYTDGRAVYSYGPHFPIAFRDDVDPYTIWVNTERYQIGQWVSGKPKFSPTTDGHIDAVKTAMSRAGYVPSTRHYSVRVDGQPSWTEPVRFQAWTRREDGDIGSVIELDDYLAARGPYAGEMAFYIPDGAVVLCVDCARRALASQTPAEPARFLLETDHSDTRYYGGIHCDTCDAEIVTPLCPECGEPLADGQTLRADNVDASRIHVRCAARLVCDGYAQRLPGIGIHVLGSLDGAPDWTAYHWYAPAGTIYQYSRH